MDAPDRRAPPTADPYPRPASGLSTKISIGFGIVLALHVSIAVLSHFGLERAKEQFRDYDQMTSQAEVMIEIDRDVAELQRAVLTYTYTGHKGVADRVQALHDELVVELGNAGDEVEDATLDENLARMMGFLEEYRGAFDLVMEDRSQRKSLVDQSLAVAGDEVSSILSRMLLSARREEDHVSASLFGEAQQSFLLARLDAGEYLNGLDASRVRSARGHLTHAAGLLAGVEDPRHDPSTREALEWIPRYDHAFVQAVQRTRGYLHLVNVVMAGVAAEFLRLSGHVRDQHLAELDLLSAQMLDDQNSFQWLSGGFSLLTIVFGVIAGALIGRAITRPLREITQTLSRLAGGDRDAQVPGRDRTDEIGEMARAAQVFKEKNQETARLLESSRHLAKQHERVIIDLREANQELDSFAYVASHDLKAPLRAISTLAAWIDEDHGHLLDDDARGHLDLMRQRVTRMNKLLEDILAFCRAGRSSFDVVEVDLHALLRDVVQLVSPPDGFDVTVDGEAIQLRTVAVPLQQTIANLVSNAIKHHDRDRGEVRITSRRHGEFVDITVQDDGPGIAPHHHRRVFEVFQTLKPRDEVESSGMGLAMVHKYVQRFGGRVWVESDEGTRGCRFQVRWPLAATPRDPALADPWTVDPPAVEQQLEGAKP